MLIFTTSLWVAATLHTSKNHEVLTKFMMKYSAEDSRLRRFHERSHRILAIATAAIFTVFAYGNIVMGLQYVYDFGEDSGIDREPPYIQAMLKIGYTLQLVFYPGLCAHFILLLWLITWHCPKFFMHAIDNLGTKLYKPRETEADWVEAHRHFQITNALLMRVSNTTSTAVTALFVGAFIFNSVLTLELRAVAQQNAFDEIGTDFLIRMFLFYFVAWFVTISPAMLLCG